MFNSPSDILAIATKPEALMTLAAGSMVFQELQEHMFPGGKVIGTVAHMNADYTFSQNLKLKVGDARRTTHHVSTPRFQVECSVFCLLGS